MAERSWSNLGMRLGPYSWPTALIGIVVIKAVLNLAVKPGSSWGSYSAIGYFLLLVLATSFAIRNGIQNTLGSRPFWVSLAIGYGLWSLHQSIYLYYNLGLHSDVPDNSIADPILFLHIVPFMAAFATLPHRNLGHYRLYRAILDSLLLLFFWSLLYGYFVFPYQYQSASTAGYPLRFDVLYFSENVALILAAGVLTLHAQGPWKSIYLHFLGASALYALSSAVANIAIDSGGYVNGKLYGLGLNAAACWFVWVPLRARQVSGAEARATQSSSIPRASAWAILIVVISIPIVWELFHREESRSARTLRLLLAITGIVCLACAAYIKEYLNRRELIFHANRKVMEAEERERNRIAIALHEDIGQRLALLAIAIEQLKNKLPNQAVELVDRTDKVWKQTLEILTDVNASAHELYSPRMEYLGIAAVMKSFSKEFGKRKQVEIDFGSDGLAGLVPRDISICLFRVLQEALHNGVKHSGAQKFEVRLWGAGDNVYLTVSDSGVGFEMGPASTGRGLGLIRMEERLRLVQGTLSVDSQPGRGTSVHARVPLSSTGAVMSAAS
jgi:signal transduction histidine kinase